MITDLQMMVALLVEETEPANGRDFLFSGGLSTNDGARSPQAPLAKLQR